MFSLGTMRVRKYLSIVVGLVVSIHTKSLFKNHVHDTDS